MILAIGMVVDDAIFHDVIDKEYAPLEDRGAFFVIADGPEGASFEKSYEMLERMEDVLMPLYDNKEATCVLLRLPASFSSTNEVNSDRGVGVYRPDALSGPADLFVSR